MNAMAFGIVRRRSALGETWSSYTSGTFCHFVIAQPLGRWLMIYAVISSTGESEFGILFIRVSCFRSFLDP